MVLLPVLSAAPARAVRDPVCNEMNKACPMDSHHWTRPIFFLRFLTFIYVYLRLFMLIYYVLPDG